MKERNLLRRQRRHDRLIRERVHDPYKTRLKLPEPTECGAVFQNGRWQWILAPANAHQDVCAACRRIKDKYPAGEVVIEGDFVREHRQEIVHLARHQENEVTRNLYVWAAVVLCLGLVFCAVYLPGLSSVLGLSPPTADGWWLAVSFSLVPWLLGQLAKAVDTPRESELRPRNWTSSGIGAIPGFQLARVQCPRSQSLLPRPLVPRAATRR